MKTAVATALLAWTLQHDLAAQPKAEADLADDTLITLQRFACEDRCAVYRLVIFADGTVFYEGQHFVRRTGLIKSGIAKEPLAKMISDLDAGGFFQLDNDYGLRNTKQCDSLDSGGPLAILSVSNQGRSKTVVHHHRCTGTVSGRVAALEDLVDRAVGTGKWIK